SVYFCFFFQAEDGIRDRNVTGVQTCALPISGDARARDHTWLCLSDTELVALWVQHDNVVEGLFIVLFTHVRGSESDQLRDFRPNQPLTLGHVPRPIPSDPNIDVHTVLRRLDLRNAQPTDRRFATVGVDDRCTVCIAEASLCDVTERLSPEGRHSLWVIGVAAQRPMHSHSPHL